MSRGNGRLRLAATGRLRVTAAVAVLIAVTAIVGARLAVRPSSAVPEIAVPPPSAGGSVTSSAYPGAGAGLAASAATASTAAPSANAPVVQPSGAPSPDAEDMVVSLTLTAADHQHCPAGATACVDLARHIAWLQHDGKVSYGPVQMEPGRPTGAHQTPRGTFHVSWKAGPAFRSSEYNEAMPWATFFAAGGIAFHGGPLNVWSHGCVHLSDSNAHYFQQHLPLGSEVVVF